MRPESAAFLMKESGTPCDFLEHLTFSHNMLSAKMKVSVLLSLFSAVMLSSAHSIPTKRGTLLICIFPTNPYPPSDDTAFSRAPIHQKRPLHNRKLRTQPSAHGHAPQHPLGSSPARDPRRTAAHPSAAFSTFFGDITRAPYIADILQRIADGAAVNVYTESPVLFCPTAAGQLVGQDIRTGELRDVYKRCSTHPHSPVNHLYGTRYTGFLRRVLHDSEDFWGFAGAGVVYACHKGLQEIRGEWG